jgi:hypothetical protein
MRNREALDPSSTCRDRHDSHPIHLAQQGLRQRIVLRGEGSGIIDVSGAITGTVSGPLRTIWVQGLPRVFTPARRRLMQTRGQTSSP